MRIIKYFEVKKKETKEIDGAIYIKEPIRKIEATIPCHLNVFYTDDKPSIVLNTDKRSVCYEHKDGIIKLTKRQDFTQSFNKNESIDIYLNKDVESLILRGDTVFKDHDFGFYDNISIFNSVRVTIKNFKKKELVVKSVNNSSLNIDSEQEFIDFLEINSSSSSKINTIKLNALKVHTTSSSFSNIKATAIEEIHAKVNGTSNQHIYGKPPIVNKKIENIGSLNIMD